MQEQKLTKEQMEAQLEKLEEISFHLEKGINANEEERVFLTEMKSDVDTQFDLVSSALANFGGPADFVYLLAIFALAIFVGYYVVWSVTPAPAHTAYVGDQCHLLGDYCWCPDCRWRRIGLGKCRGDCQGAWLSCYHTRQHQYIWGLYGHPAHARHV